MKTFTTSKKNNLRAGLLEILIGLSVATALIYYWQSNSAFTIGAYLTSLFEASFNSSIVPDFKIFTSVWMLIIGVLIMLTASVLIHSFVRNNTASKIKERQTKYQDFFADVVADESTEISTAYFSQNQPELKQHLSKEDFTDPANRKALLKELKATYDLISGSEKSKLRELYFGLGYVDELKTKFEHKKWNVRVEAIQEAKQFGVKQMYPRIFKLVDDSDDLVRRNALIARVDLDDEPMSFLGDIDYILCKWERHKILSTLVKLPSHKLPNFSSLYHIYPLHKDFLEELGNYFDQSGYAKVLQMA